MATAVEWLIDNWIKFNDIDIELDDFANLRPLLEQAKQMEKEQIMDAFLNGDNSDCMLEQNIKEFAEKYYNETYKIKK